jgi:hypothetical protein
MREIDESIMTPSAEEPTTVLSLPLLKTPQEAKAFVKKNFGHVVLKCFTIQANPKFSGSVGTGKYIFVVNDDEFPEAGRLDRGLVAESMDKHGGAIPADKLPNWETTEFSIGSHHFIRFRLLKGKTPEDGGYLPDSIFTIPVFCPRRDLLMADKGLAKMYIDFINTLTEEVSEMKGQPAAIASSNNDYYQLEQVQFMGGSPKNIPFIVLSMTALKISTEDPEDRERQKQQRKELNPKWLVAVSPFAYLNDTIEIAKLYANTDLDIKRSVAICPLCNMAYEAVGNRAEKKK